MAGNRENQGLQIACILLVMVVTLLAVTTCVLYRQSEENFRALQAATEERSRALEVATRERDQVRVLKHFLGFGELSEADLDLARASFDQELRQIETHWRQDMERFGATLPETKNYRAIPEILLGGLHRKNQTIAARSERADTLDQERTQIEQDAKQRVDAALAEAKRRAEELLAANKTQATHRSQWEQLSDAVRQKLTALQAEFAAQLAQAKRRSDDLARQIELQRALIEEQQRRLTLRAGEAAEVPVGVVTHVDQRGRTVYVNLGTADGLRRGVSLTVYDQKHTDLSQAKSKATIEVTKTLEAHLAEARIVRDMPSDPILPQDQLHSAAWRPGRSMEFALAGWFDVNRDGQSDRPLVRSLIAANGGKIVCEVHDDGTVTGQLSATTDCLVLGERPTDTASPAALQSFTSILQRAQELGIRRQPLDRLFSHP